MSHSGTPPFSVETQQLSLQEFSTRRDFEGEELSPVLTSIIKDVALSGTLRHEWSLVKKLLAVQLELVLRSYQSRYPDLREENGEKFEDILGNFKFSLDSFAQAPFTLQRLCELLMDPERHYKSLRKLTGAIDKVVNVSIHGSEVLRVSLAQDSASWGGDSAIGVGESVPLDTMALQENSCTSLKDKTEGSSPMVDHAEFSVQGSELAKVVGTSASPASSTSSAAAVDCKSPEASQPPQDASMSVDIKSS